ncbi:GIY-YIG nuclease family protein [Paenibacillus herberti]|uniref:Nucleotide excision repair endonuclease n=1 Tax=Paenibacillus herberti TaxID=1619309 RepID=A0A229NUG6_9BACL|nr:GIY-YIG nuclease family protein [Paenibacillus herberti]OXM13512.1 nucleotide excision repair endonuclease [Paenibacillus herberti]
MPFVFKAGDYPEKPGCYLMRDASGRLLYVGKSKNLRSRLRSYFYSNKKIRRLQELVENIADIEVLLVNNETESLLLENNLIKIHKPPYNRALKKDNSGYAYLMLTTERIPRLAVYYRDRREPEVRPSEHLVQVSSVAEPKRFGPFASARFRNELLEFVADHYKLRSCTKLPKRACLLYHIGKCSGICEGHHSEEDYAKDVRQVSELLFDGGKDALIARMYAQMSEYAEELKFEKAQNMLSHIRNLEKTPEKQIVDRETNLNQEVLYFGEQGVMVAKVQEGMLRELQMVELERGYDEAACDRFLIRRYREQNRPDELIVNRIADPAAVRRALRRPGDRLASPLTITQPKRGLKHSLLQLCKENYDFRVKGVIVGGSGSEREVAASSENEGN